jgi:signal transduction histidine kinase
MTAPTTSSTTSTHGSTGAHTTAGAPPRRVEGGPAHPASSDEPTLVSRRRPVTAGDLAALASLGLAAAGAARLATTAGYVALVAVAGWAISGVVLDRRRPDAAIDRFVAAVPLVAGALLLTTSWSGNAAADVARAVLAALLPAAVAIAVIAAPDGTIRPASHRAATIGCAVGAAIGAVALLVARPDVPPTVVVIESLYVGGWALAAFVTVCGRAAVVTRARLQWIGWGFVVGGATAAAVVVVHWATEWPARPVAGAIAASLLPAAGFVAGTVPALLRVVDRVLVHTVVVLGMTLFVVCIYTIAVLGLHGVPEDGERTVLALSVAAALAIAVSGPAVHRRLHDAATARTYGAADAPGDALETFATRMSRAIPMDELLLQLAESLRKSMRLVAAEVWTGAGGVYERTVSVPDRPARRIELTGESLAVAGRAHVQGNAWLAVWIPQLLDGTEGRAVRFTSVSHLGELLGFLVTERAPEDVALDEEDEHRLLVDIARQLGLALHNVRLDTALQASLDELRAANEELVASRARIVTASDESRRRIERNLHDGAQQHLVALAVKVGLIGQLLDADPATATAMLDELRGDVQATLTELRELAHGIYPPLLRDRGLAEALRTAATRSTLPVSVDAGSIGRYQPEIETAVYFCCLEAIQNAGKHAGAAASVEVALHEIGDNLEFVVADDGTGFDVDVAAHGDGFVNMRDRLGAFAGTMTVVSTPGQGTMITGRLPIADA